ncbi:MAG: serine protease [Rhodobacteraceae bacterium]|jgi:peptidoglycan hydrolase-like protein with peptidoglycan-binding domain|nr:serine protease [Paracoccaceae bacterium]
MRSLVTVVILVWFGLVGATMVAGSGAARAQSFVQIEALPTLVQAEERARAWGATLPDVAGFQLRSGLYAIALGPYAPDEAQRRLADLRLAGQIPADSYLAEADAFARQFWPAGASLGASLGAAAAPQAVPVQTPALAATDPALGALLPDETEAEARRSEAALSPEARRDLQTALQFKGFYTAAIDGAFGPGTRASMSAWQAANGFPVTGILTTRQRAQLLDSWQAVTRSLGLAPLVDVRAGIEMTAPLGLVAFDRYEPPFAHYDPVGDSGVRLSLISQTGDRATLFGLYDLLQTLDIVPPDGPRERRETDFTITGVSETMVTTVYAAEANGQVKGYILAWPANDEQRRTIAIEAIRASFTPRADAVLPDSVGEGAVQSVDLLAGLEIRRPVRVRSGFWVSADGAVLTSADAVEGCARVTIDTAWDAQVAASDAGLGVALLRPVEALAAPAVARLRQGDVRLRSEVALAGFAFDGRLGQPTLTFGSAEDLRAPDGTPGVLRLALAAEASEAGGAVLDSTGAVAGLLLPPPEGARLLPPGVALAADAARLGAFLAGSGQVPAAPAAAGVELAPEDLQRVALGLAVKVGCWD